VVTRGDEQGVGPGLPDRPGDRGVEIGDDHLRRLVETAEERPPRVGILGSGDRHQARPRAAGGPVEGDHDRAGPPVAHAGCAGVVGCLARDPGEERGRVEDDDPGPDRRMQRGEDRRGICVEVVDREVGLAAGGAMR
jgi:hypothetical protein